jgi:biopolymer transport protein TolR
MAEINVTPLVDVMLVLLIIFMVTAPLLSAGVPIDLPDSNAKPLDQTPTQVNLSITPDGTIYIDKLLVDPGTLPDRLAALSCGTAKKQQINLRADKLLEYGKVMAVMGELNHAGCNAISLVTNSSVAAP